MIECYRLCITYVKAKHQLKGNIETKASVTGILSQVVVWLS